MQIFSIPTPTTSTNLFLLLFLSLLFILDSMTLNVINRLLLYRHPRMKPTKFHYPPGLSPLILFPPPPTPHRHFDRRTKNIDSRYTFIKVLGLGREGSASVYHDSLSGKKVVIKGFFQGVRKNPLPVHLQKLGGDGKWPAEIPATLYFANANAPGEFETGREERRGKGGFIYAVDYFWVDSWLGGSEWRLVTPFLRFGTLETLAELLKQRGMSPSELDMVYRRRFRGVLVALREMHQAGYVCTHTSRENNG